jgi:hypothetical protein
MRDTRGVVRRKTKKASINALSVKIMGTIGPIARKVIQRTLQLLWLKGILLCIAFYFSIVNQHVHYFYWSCREPPKKRKRSTKASQSSIVTFEDDEAPASFMSYPPAPQSISLEPPTKKKKKEKDSASSSGKSARSLFSSRLLNLIFSTDFCLPLL